MNRLFPRELFAAAIPCLLLSSACAHAVSAAGSDATNPSAAGVCSAREVARVPLLVEGGRALYVQPVILEPNGLGDALLAGDISFMLERRDGRWRFTREDSTFGAIIPASGEPVVVPAPIPTRRIGGSRALARADGAWDVVFAQVHDYTGESRPYTVEQLWHGVLDGARWKQLEPVPLPATRLNRPGLDQTALFARRNGAWEHEIVPSMGNGYPRLAYSDSLGLVLALVGPDRTLTPPYHDANSLILWTRHPEWRHYRKLVPSSREQVYDPWISLAPGREVVAWVAGVEDEAGARTEAHAMSGRLDEAAPVVVLDSALHPHGQFSVRPLELAPGNRLWVFQHGLADHTRELRVVQESGAAPVLLASVPSEFPAGFMAALPAPGQLLVAGAEYDAAQQMIVSLLLRFQVDCPSP
jgi:hypothetical protein